MNKTKLALDLFEAGAIRFGEFRLKLHNKYPNAPRSPYYIDLRILQSYPKLIEKVAEALVDKIHSLGLEPDLVSGIPAAGVPIATLTSFITGIPMITLRKKKKTHGISTRIMGVYRPGQKVLVIDDLVTKAHTKLEAIGALIENELMVKELLVLIDREQGGKQKLEDEGYNLRAVFPVTELMELYLEQEKIDREKYDKIMEYLENPLGS